jgi:hypothetical protein
LKEIFDEEKNDNVVFKLNRVRVGTLLHPFLQQASGKIFKDDVNGFFLHLGYLLQEYKYGE